MQNKSILNFENNNIECHGPLYERIKTMMSFIKFGMIFEEGLISEKHISSLLGADQVSISEQRNKNHVSLAVISSYKINIDCRHEDDLALSKSDVRIFITRDTAEAPLSGGCLVLLRGWPNSLDLDSIKNLTQELLVKQPPMIYSPSNGGRIFKSPSHPHGNEVWKFVTPVDASVVRGRFEFEADGSLGSATILAEVTK